MAQLYQTTAVSIMDVERNGRCTIGNCQAPGKVSCQQCGKSSCNDHIMPGAVEAVICFGCEQSVRANKIRSSQRMCCCISTFALALYIVIVIILLTEARKADWGFI